MNNPKVSVLVPVYNVSKYIERCLHSLFRQTFNDLEYIFVNDATIDDSMKILTQVIEQYPQHKQQIKIINHQFNQGIATTRNTALDNSSGEYILFIDSDDYIELNMIELLYDTAKKEQADIVVSDVILEYKSKPVIISDVVSENKDENFYNMLVNEVCHSYRCNKLITRKLYKLEDCRTPDGLNYWEDRYVMIRFYYYANKIAKVNQALYHYDRSNANSVTSSINKMHFENALQFWKELEVFLMKQGIFTKYQDIIERSKVKTKISLLFDTDIPALRGEYADIFLKEEKKYFKQLKTVEKIMLFLIHRKQLRLSQVIRKLLVWKHKITD